VAFRAVTTITIALQHLLNCIKAESLQSLQTCLQGLTNAKGR